MSYTVLARRYRSGNFDQVIGQSHIAQTLKKAIATGRIAHAYLFCGTRGTGKTSTARILAKALNCRADDKPTPEPCGVCASCQAVARGDDIDVIEIDAASNTGVDNIRELIENSRYRPAISRFKVYIIDEVHMLSKSAFNALLKTLEEPPEHVKFILATTEPEKVLPTILSRCQRYDFRNIPTRQIAGHLKEICASEKIGADEDALLLVAKAGAGSMRDSLSLLDRLLSAGEQHLTAEMIEQLLGLPRSQAVFELVAAIGEGDVGETLGRSQKILQTGMMPDTLAVAVIDHLRNLLILRTCGKDSELVEVPGLPPDELARQSDQFDPGVLAQDITILEELRRQMRQSQAGRALFDATLVRLALAPQFTSVSELLNNLSAGGTPVMAGPVRAASRPVVAQKKNDPPALISPPPQPAPMVEPTVMAISGAEMNAAPGSGAVEPDEDDNLPAVGKVWDGPGPLPKLELPSARINPMAKTVVDASDSDAVWCAVKTQLQDRPGIWSLLAQGRFAGFDDSRAVIQFAPSKATFVSMLEKNGKADQLRQVLSDIIGKKVGIKFDVVDLPETPIPVEEAGSPTTAAAGATVIAPPGPRLTQDLKDSLRDSDALIRCIIEDLGGEIIKVE